MPWDSCSRCEQGSLVIIDSGGNCIPHLTAHDTLLMSGDLGSRHVASGYHTSSDCHCTFIRHCDPHLTMCLGFNLKP